ncbi:pilus assembly protein (plasmid) [Paracoccus liaowanqingii]|uniref:Pilus assembly protein n=2 Tax=Paracoccus liaowanqingii TaxID=2560053 RepID=A0A4Y5SQJ2_9RHOB|nr:pilus assembly protein [Paracoccus liaowanqingii]
MKSKGMCCSMRFFPPVVHHKLSDLIPSERGASAIEFALLAPFLIVALLGTVDVGRALTEHMIIGSLLRTGAQGAIAGGDGPEIENIIRASNKDTLVAVNVVRICTCPESAPLSMQCDTTCAGSAPTNIHYSLTAQKLYDSIFLSDISLSRRLQVQVR